MYLSVGLRRRAPPGGRGPRRRRRALVAVGGAHRRLLRAVPVAVHQQPGRQPALAAGPLRAGRARGGRRQRRGRRHGQLRRPLPLLQEVPGAVRAAHHGRAHARYGAGRQRPGLPASLTPSASLLAELAGVFQKYLREYASSVLQSALPRGGGPGGAGALPLALAGASVPSLVTNLHTFLRDDQTAR